MDFLLGEYSLRHYALSWNVNAKYVHFYQRNIGDFGEILKPPTTPP